MNPCRPFEYTAGTPSEEVQLRMLASDDDLETELTCQRENCQTSEQIRKGKLKLSIGYATKDHGALNWLLESTDTERQTVRSLEIFGTYKVTIQHRPGRRHDNAEGRQCNPRDYSKRQQVKDKESSMANIKMVGGMRLGNSDKPNDLLRLKSN
ncbi:hypothetical protein CHS0354_041416 [Potamilus streckersoni]|uniref:Uncharacterized protein n=1 Tax=Potamilus streckersoni TaxID=2493646 RepID=A0AAE0TAW5_9BIVA|nr:hypothetical protein CHS0354_041416 [Potamilus streckersoni]